MSAFTRSYISTIPTVKQWKEDHLDCYSDAHKDVHGCRWVPSYLLEAEYPMEAVMDAVTSIYAQASEVAREEYEYDLPYVHAPILFTNNMVI